MGLNTRQWRLGLPDHFISWNLIDLNKVVKMINLCRTARAKATKKCSRVVFISGAVRTCSEFEHLPAIFLPPQCELAEHRKRHSGRLFLYCHVHKLNLTQKISDYEIFMF